MVTDLQLAKTLNLPRTSPTFAYRQCADGSLSVLQPGLIPNDGSIYWLAGHSVLASGKEVASVFVIEHGGGNLVGVYWFGKLSVTRAGCLGGGNLGGVYWFVDNAWYKSDDPDASDALGIPQEGIFPFDWKYAIPVENDIFHQ